MTKFIYYQKLAATLLVQSRTAISLQLPSSHQQRQSQEDPEARCLSCIRSVTSIGVDPNKRCEGGYFCGPFQFSYQYWAESGKPGNIQGIRDFEKCARDKQCAEQTVRAYFKKFKRDCNNDGVVDCLDMAALHKAGPSGCSSDWFYKSRYWSTFNKTACSSRRDFAGSSQMEKSELFNQDDNHRPIPVKNQTLTSECLDCICEALSSCSSASTNNCGSGLVCGPFAISQAYWKDGKRPGASWTACARTKECSSLTIRNYMEKYKRDCNADGYLTCEDYAAIHRRGPMSCTNRDLLKEQYWTKFLTCRANQKPMNDVNLVKVNEDTPDQINTLTSRGDTPGMFTDPSISSTQSTNRDHSSTTLQGQSSIATTVSPTTINDATTPFPSASNTRLRPSYQERNEQVSSSRLPSGLSNENTIYELNPVVLETKATSNRVRNYQTARPSQSQQVYEHPNHGGELQAQQQDSIESSQSSSSPIAPIHESESSRPENSEINMNQEPAQQRRPPIDYNSMPTIIVSKRIEAHSANRNNMSPAAVPANENSMAPSINTSSMTTATSIAATFPYRDITTTVSPNLDSAPNQGTQFASPSSASNSQIIDQIMDYPLTDFGTNGPGVDRASFDRVVSGIVANPDFSVPEVIVQRKQTSSPNPPRGPQKETVQTTKPTAGNQPTAATGSKRENSKTLSPNIYNAVETDHQTQTDGDQSSLGSLIGPNALNMTNLFEKGLNESSRIASECLDCICDASSNCDATVQCISKQREKNRCGLYMISWNQYKESDISLTAMLSPSASNSPSQNDDADEKLYYECATDKNCAEKLIHLYIEKYQKDCNLDGKIDCYDIAAIHRVGPDSCNSSRFLASQYWRDFNHCYITDRLTTTVQPQLPSSQGS